MIFTKTPCYKKYAKPLDKGKCLKDGKRIFGDNKTMVGFWSMVILGGIFQCLWGIACAQLHLEERNMVYQLHDNSFWYNLCLGFGFGFAYMICELPNSFVKRRINIASGKTANGIKGIAFFIIDQIDSMFGVGLVLAMVAPIGIDTYFQFVLLGGITHISVNLILFSLKIRKNI
ncbi:CDP-archaeol synthase [Roseburia sp. MSJ-14]|uniref:CDP-archaeol synthase n=1 Tax=Roseburia sp. MSJ-14 TaxID=2841514 RepID=UPI001C112111|nr:CDP-archaeol synthase [Roseburia sp. MSJ-14]MBU5474352.1 CDP-archaeol synthase [Roseburia sp. MSJ-14]